MPAKSSILVSLQPLARSVHLTSFQLQGSTKTPLRGTKGRLVRLRTMERARDRTPPWVAPLDARPRGAPPSPSYTEQPDGGGQVHGSRERGRGRGRDDSECLLAKRPNAGAGPRREARIRSVHRRAVRMSNVWRRSRPGRAPRRTGIAAEAIRCCGAVTAEEYARADDIFCW